MAAQISSAINNDDVPLPLVITDQTTSQELIDELKKKNIEENVLKYLVDKNIDGEQILTKGFVSKTFTPQVVKNHNINPQKLIEIRNSLLLSSPSVNIVVATPQTQMASLTATIQGLPVFANDNLATALPILERLSQGNSYVSSVFKFVHSAAFAVNNIWYDGAKQRCLDLLHSVKFTIQASPKFILSPPQRFNGAFAELRAVIKEVAMLVATFVPPTDDVPFKQNAQYWLALLTAKKDDFERLEKKLDKVCVIIVTQIVIFLAQHALGNDDDDQNEVDAPTENLNVEKFTEDLLVSVREWYDSHFKFELGSKGNVNLAKLFIELKVLQTTNEDKKTKDQETLLNSGKIADTSSLHQHLWTGSSLSNIVLVEGPAGIGKTSFCMKLCCLQNIEGAVVIFVPLKHLLGCGKIDSISTLLSIINSPVSAIIALPNILHYNIPIIWVLDGFDEVMRTDDYSVQLFLNNFLDPITRKKNLDNNNLPNLVRPCDFVILTSRENRIDTNIVTIDGVNDPKLKPDLWIVQRWIRNNIETYINNFFKTLNKPISEADVQLLVDHSLGPQMSGFHGIPLFIKLLCEAKLEDEKLDLTNISPPFLYHKTLRNAFVRAKIRIEYVLDTNPQFIRYKSDPNGLYDKILNDASKHAFQEFLAHRGTALTFSVPCDEVPPLWILVMREMGVLLNDSDESKFKFQHRTFIEYLAAQFAALNPDEALPLVPLLDELDTTWLLICQLACLRENDGFFKRLLEKGLTTTFLANHVVERFLKGYRLERKGVRHTGNRKEILALSDEHHIKLLVQIANSLPKNVFMNSLLDKHGRIVLFTPSQFKWMTEWCGYYGAIDVLKWFDDKTRFRSSVLSQQNCRFALCRALQRQSVSNVKATIDFLVPRAGDLSVFDAIATESVVALQMALRKKNKFDDDDDLIRMFKEMVDRSDSNPNLIVAMCLFTDFTEDQLSKLDVVAPSPAYFFIAVALQVALPEIAEIWNFTTKKFEKINVVDEMKKRPVGRILSESRDISKNWDKKITEIFVKECIPKLRKKMSKLKNCFYDLHLSVVNELVTDATIELICDCFPLLRSLNLSSCENITSKSLQSLMKLELLENLDLSKCNGIPDVKQLHLLLLARRETLTTVKLEDLPQINFAYRVVAPRLIADSSLSILDFGLRHVTDEVLGMLLEFGNPITSLNLSGCTKITSAVFDVLASARGIAHLDLSQCVGIDDLSSLHSFLIARRETLTTLKLDGLQKINSAYCVFAPQLIADSSLSTFDFIKSPNVTDEILRMLLEFGNPITSVKLQGCTKLTSDVIGVLSSVRSLTHLDLSHCVGIDDLAALHSFLLARPASLKTVKLDDLPQINFAYRVVAPRLIADSSLSILDFGLRHVTDEVLGMLLEFGNPITSLNLSGCTKITSAVFDVLASARGIAHLDLSQCVGIDDLSSLHSFLIARRETLKTVKLDGLLKINFAYRVVVPQLIADSSLSTKSSGVTDEVLGMLLEFGNPITSVDLSCCNSITDAGIHHIAKLAHLTSLNLFRCGKITDAGLEHISKLSNITSLNLDVCYKITDAGLQHVSKLSNITSLDLSGCEKITDAGLEQLSKLSNITSLTLLGCDKITIEAKEKLKAALPNCRI